MISAVWGMGYWGKKQDIGKPGSFPRLSLRRMGRGIRNATMYKLHQVALAPSCKALGAGLPWFNSFPINTTFAEEFRVDFLNVLSPARLESLLHSIKT
jgi:hypothetical protein